MKEMLGGCCVCSDEIGWSDNPLIYCDGPECEVAVHQGCYGIQEVPEGEWLCDKCRSSTSFADSASPRVNGLNGKSKRPVCELCPLGYGALKRTENGGWAHVVCALYIPEARFGDVHTMDPVILSEIPTDRFSKICYICAEENPKGGRMGACMGCHRPSCKRYFHVTCAQQKGLLCEETGISKTVKYCGFCQYHIKKGAADPSIKPVPACRIPRPEPTVVDQPTPPNSHNSGHMLVDPIPRPEQINTVLGLSQPTDDAHLVNNFSPPLTTSSRSSVALDSTPPLAASSSSLKSEMKIEVNGTASSSNSLNALMNMGQNHNRIPEVAIPALVNGHSDEKPPVDGAYTLHITTPSVSRPPVSVKRPKELMKSEVAAKKPRNNNRKSNMKSEAIADFQALLDAVGPVVSETVSDFQRERVAVRSEAERRQAAVQPSTSHETPATSSSHKSLKNPPPIIASTSSSHAIGSSPSTSKETNNLPASMEQLLERQWDQGAGLMLGQAQFDVSQLLTCLHQLKQENSRLEEQLVTLSKRREHLLALNARLSIPLTIDNHSTRHNQLHNPGLASPHHSPHVVSSEDMNQLRSLGTNRVLANSQRPPSQAAPTMSTFVAPQRAPVSTASIPQSQLSTPPATQNSGLPSAPVPGADLANISPERLAALAGLPGLGLNFNLTGPQRNLIPNMDQIMASMLLQQIGPNAVRGAFPQGANNLFGLNGLIPQMNGPTGQNGTLSK